MTSICELTVLGLSCRPELSNILPTEKLRTVLRPGGTDPLLFTVIGDRTVFTMDQSPLSFPSPPVTALETRELSTHVDRDHTVVPPGSFL